MAKTLRIHIFYKIYFTKLETTIKMQKTLKHFFQLPERDTRRYFVKELLSYIKTLA